MFQSSSKQPRSSMQLNENHFVAFVKQHWILVVIGAVVFGLLAFFTYSYIDTRNQLNDIKGAATTEKLVDEIAKVIELPNEEATLITVSDASKLASQEFFANAQNGDNVLIFPEAGRALLYRPTTKKIIEYSKVNLGTNVAQ